MRTSLVVTVLSLAAAGCLRDPAGLCEEGGPAFAVDPATGDCFEFATECDVPPGWSDCGGIEGEGEGEGEGEDCEDRGCPPGQACRDGECVGMGGECGSDEDCPETQHCVLSGDDPSGGDGAARPVPPKEDGKEAESEAESEAAGEEGEAVDVPARPGDCQDNDYCWSDADCPDRHFCDPSAWAEGEAEEGADAEAAPVCDPSECGEGEAEAESEGEPPAGLCRRGRRGTTARECSSEADCGDRQACSADWGVCCEGVSPGGGEGEAEAEPVWCAGVCAALCFDAADCADGEWCNTDACILRDGDSAGEDPACQGFCLPADCW